MAKKVEEKSSLEFLESSEGLQQEIGKVQTVVEKNKNVVFGVLGAIVVCVLGYFGYKAYSASQDEEGQAKLFPTMYKLEADSNKVAAKEAAKVADGFGGKAGNLAHFIAGTANLKEGKYDTAIEHLKAFSADDLLVQARAYALIGDAYSEKKAYSDAIDYYKKAVEYKPNKQFTLVYMKKLAINYEANKQPQEALAVYTEMVEKYADTQEGQEAKKYRAMLEVE
jgi:tetratricopeptide (TPR) repeat protein